MVIPDFDGVIDLALNGDIEIMNIGEVQAEAGIASALIRIGQEGGAAEIMATSDTLSGNLEFEVE